MKKLFNADILSKRQRVERAIHLQPVDRVPIHEQLSYNPQVIGHFCGRDVSTFDYTTADIGRAIAATLDCTFPLFPPLGTGDENTDDGFTYRLDNWTKWRTGRPFTDEHGAAAWLRQKTDQLQKRIERFDATAERAAYRCYMQQMQKQIDDTVIMDWSITTGFCEAYDHMGLEIFSYFLLEYPDVLQAYMEVSSHYAAIKAGAVGDIELSPLVLIAEDFSTMQGPLFSSEMLQRYHYPAVRMLTDAWHSHGLKVVYHTDGNFRKAIPDLIDCGVDGFYCLERNCGMHIEPLAEQYPHLIWMGGVDGVATMEFGRADDVRSEVEQIIRETNALERGGIFIDTSSEINPTIPLANYLAMIEACGQYRNHDFRI